MSVVPVQATEQVRLGILTEGDYQQLVQRWTATADYLNHQISAYRFELIPLSEGMIDTAVKQQEVDFLLVDPATYVRLEAKYRIGAIATLHNDLGRGDSNGLFAGVFLVRDDHKAIQHIQDIKGHRLGAVSPTSFGGWAMAARQMLLNDMQPYRDPSTLLFLGSHEAVVNAVLNGEVDVGTVRSGVVERMARAGRIDAGLVRILPEEGEYLHDQEDAGLMHSTISYPEWPMAHLPHVDGALVRQVTAALLAMRVDEPAAREAGIDGWYPPASYIAVHDLMKDLHMAQYAHAGEVGWRQVLDQYGDWLVAALIVLLLFVIVIGYILQLNMRLGRVNRRLTKEIDEKSRAQKELVRQKARLDSTLENIIEAYFKVDSNWCIVELNNHAKALINKSLGQVQGEEIWTVFPELAEAAALTIKRSKATGEAMEFEVYARASQHWFLIHCHPTESEMNVYIKDISDRYKNLARAEENEQRLVGILNNILEAVVTIDEYGIMQTFNHAAEQIFGYTSEEVIGKNIAMLMPAEFAKMHDHYIRNHVSTGQTTILGKEREIEGLRNGGQRFPLEAAISDVTVGGHRMYIGVMRDISERKRAEEKIQRLLAAMSFVKEGVFVVDKQGHLEYSNRAYDKMAVGHDFPSDDHLAYIFGMAKQDPNGFGDILASVQQQRSWSHRYRVGGDEAETMWEEATLAPVEDKWGEIYCYVGVCRDVTEQVNKEERKLQSEKIGALAQLASEIAHQFNNSLATITGYTEMALLELDGNETVVDDLQKVMEAANRAKVSVSRMVELSSQELEAHHEFDPCEVSHDVVDLLRSMLPQPEQLDFEMTEPLGIIAMSPEQFQKLLLSLGMNAIKAIETVAQGKIAISIHRLAVDKEALAKLSLERVGDYLLLEIEDNGVGIDPSIQNKIFQPFFTTSKESGAQGMGLSTVYGIVQSHGGTIDFDSSPGKGTKFSIYLPLAG